MNFKTIFLLLIIPVNSNVYILAASRPTPLSKKSDPSISVSQLVDSWGYRPAAAFILAIKNSVHAESSKQIKIENLAADINLVLHGLLRLDDSLNATETELYTIMGHVRERGTASLEPKALCTASLALIKAETDYLKTLEINADKVKILARPPSQT